METQTQKTTAQSNEILRTIYERRAVRKYKDQPVPEAILQQLLDAGRMAPSAINKQPWKFYILRDEKIIHAFSKEIAHAATKMFMHAGVKAVMKTVWSSFHLLKGMKFFREDDPVFHGAPLVVFITAPKDNEWASLDVGMCAQNMMLAAKSLGLESCPIGFGKYVEQTELFPKLKVPSSEHVLLSLIFGYGDETPELHKREKDNVTFIDAL